MPRGLHRDLVVLAEGEGVSLNQLLVSLLARAVGGGAGGEASVGGVGEQAFVEAVYRVADRVEDVAAQVGEVAAGLDDAQGRVDDLEDAWVEDQKGFLDYAIEAASEYPLGRPAQHRRKAIQQAHLNAGEKRIGDRVRARMAARVEAADHE